MSIAMQTLSTGASKDALSSAVAVCFGNTESCCVIAEARCDDDPEGHAASGPTPKNTRICKEFHAWTALLCHWSEVLDAQCKRWSSDQSKRIVIPDSSPDAVEALLFFMYSGTLRCTFGNVLDVFKLADKYMVRILSDLCLRLVKNNIDECVAAGLTIKRLQAAGFSAIELGLKAKPSLGTVSELLSAGFGCRDVAFWF